MIAVIMAAGKGSRLGEITLNKPKSLLTINEGFTLLDYNINILKEIGVAKIYIVTGFMADKIEKHVQDIENVICIYNPFWDSCNVLGSLFMALPYIDEDFLFAHADTLVGVDGWVQMVDTEGEIVLPYKEKQCGEEEMKIRVDDAGNLLEITKQMDPFQAKGEFLGIAKFDKSMVNFFQVTSEYLFKQGLLNSFMESVLQQAINVKEIKLLNIGIVPFVEVDFIEDYELARRLFS